MLVSCIYLFVAMFVCFRPAAYYSTAIFTRLHTQVGTDLRKKY